jgi:poly(A) polymerase
LPPQRWHEPGAILEGCDRALRDASRRVTIPRRVSLGVREMYALQPRLEQPRGKRALRLLDQPRFRAGYDLLHLRAQFGLASPEIAQWWTRLQEIPPEERVKALDTLPAAAAPPGIEAGTPAGTPGAGGGVGRTRRRRRRRRSPGPA